jgi:hypothetical protein
MTLNRSKADKGKGIHLDDHGLAHIQEAYVGVRH